MARHSLVCNSQQVGPKCAYKQRKGTVGRKLYPFLYKHANLPASYLPNINNISFAI